MRVCIRAMFSATVWVKDCCNSTLFPIHCSLAIWGEVGGYWAPCSLNFRNEVASAGPWEGAGASIEGGSSPSPALPSLASRGRKTPAPALSLTWAAALGTGAQPHQGLLGDFWRHWSRPHPDRGHSHPDRTRCGGCGVASTLTAVQPPQDQPLEEKVRRSHLSGDREGGAWSQAPMEEKGKLCTQWGFHGYVCGDVASRSAMCGCGFSLF